MRLNHKTWFNSKEALLSYLALSNISLKLSDAHSFI